MNNFFVNNDPVLGGNSFDSKIAELQQAQQQVELQKRLYEQQLSQKPTGQQSKSQSPVWDEVDTLWDSLSDKEREIISSSEEFQESSNHITAILNEQYMAMMRPVVEQKQEGKEALDKHLALLKRMQKTAKEEAGKKEALMNEYITQYSHLTWQEFIDMKNGKRPVAKSPKK